MEQSVAQISKPDPGMKGQGQSWNSSIKISELLDYSVANSPYRMQSSASVRQYLSGGSAKSDQSNKLLYRASPVDTPWSQCYKGLHTTKPPHREKPTSCSLADVERKLSSLILDHTEDEIYQRDFLDVDGCEISPDRGKEDMPSVVPTTNDHQDLLSLRKQYPKTKKVIHRSPKQLKAPSKSSKRHRFCLSKYPHSRKNKKILFVKEADEIQHEVTVDQKGLKEAWEFFVLEKLSNETQCFINHRFDGKEKPKERLVDFLDAGYRDKDRSDYMTKRKKRLFDMPYKHDDFPGASTHL